MEDDQFPGGRLGKRKALTVIGLTLVAVGTSLPELATSVTAAFKARRITSYNVCYTKLLRQSLQQRGQKAYECPSGEPSGDEYSQ